MRALRLRFLLVGLGVLVPVALLVWRALASLEVERRARHEAVAERLFDEMERALSELLEGEEARPVAAYAAPAATPTDPAFVLGRFEIDPAGGVQAPPGARAAVERLRRRAAAEVGEVPRPGASGVGEAIRPGATVDLAGGRAPGPKEQVAVAPAPARAPSAYEALRSLNQAAEQREARQKKLAAADDVPAKAARSAPAAPASPSPARAGEGDAGARAPGALADAVEAPRGVDDAAEGPDADPMTGRLVDAGHLALSRAVVRDGGVWRQGVVLDVAALEAWLRARTLGSSELAGSATVALAPAGVAMPAARDARGPELPAAPDGYFYLHRFADPFAALAVRLDLRPLPGLGGAGYVHALAVLLAVASIVGLLALYRMVAVQLAFARRRGDFVAAVTHELKTPLTAIRMYGEMLRDGLVASDAKRDEYHRHITAESERLSRLIDNVLEFSRLEKQARPMATVVGPVAPVLEDAAALLRPHVEQAGFALRLEVAPGLPSARFDRDALLQVLVNLVDNAVKYAAGAARREIVLRAAVERDRVVVAVRDHGPGVPTEHLAHIFEPFYRGERELVRRSKGTGLGLALVSGLGLAMGAVVGGRNVPDGGFEGWLGLRTDPA